MSLWNYIGEFLLFRWLFGLGKRDATEHDSYGSSFRSFRDDFDNHTNPDTGSGSRYDSPYSRYDHHDYGYSQSYDDFHDEQDDYDMMDDDF